MGLLDWLFGTKKKKKKDTNKWAKQAESAKRNTQSNSKKAQRVSSNRPKATTTKPVSSSSRRGSYVSSATQKKAQTNATSIVKANREYTAYRKQAKKDEKAHDKKYGKTLLITPKGRNAKAFHDVNKGKATFAQNTKGNSKAYENVTSFYKQNKGEQDYAKKKVEEAYKHNAFGMGLKDSLRANFFGDDNTAKKVSERIGTKINADLNNEKYQSGKDTGLLLSYLAPGMAQGKIASGVMKGAKAVTKATQGAKAVATVGKSAPKLGKSVRMAGRARKLSAAHKVKKALKGTTKGQHFKAAMIADSMTSTPLNVSAAGAEARRVVDENKEQKQKLKAQSKEASKYLKDSKAAVAQYNKAISDVRNSSLPESEKKKYISNLKEERNKLIQSRRRVSDSKEQLDSQSKSLNTSVNKEFGKKFLEYEGMDRLLGTGLAGLTARGQFKKAYKSNVGSKAKVRKIALGENLDKVKKFAKEDIAEQARRRAKQEAKASSQVERNIGKREITFTDKDGRVLAKGVPRNKADARIMLRSARNQAGGIENIRVSSKDLGSPMSRFRSETEKLTEAPKGREPSGWETTKPLTKEDIGKMPDRPIKDSEIEAGSREANRLEEQEKYSASIDATESYTKGMESYKNSKVRKQKVKKLLPDNHKLNGNTKEISKAIDDDLSEIIARRNAGDMQGAEELENNLARRLADEDKQIYDKSLDTGDFQAFKKYVSNKPFYPPEGMTVKEAQEMFGLRNPEAKGVIKFVKRNGKRKGREIDGLTGEIDELFPNVIKDDRTVEDIFGDIREYLEGGYKRDFSLMGELSGKELDEFVDMKRADIRSAIRDIENDIGVKAKEPVAAKVEEPKPKAEAPKRTVLSDLESKQAQAASDLKETRQLMGATNKAETQRAFKNALKPKNTPRATFLREQLGKAETEEEFNIIRDELRRVGEPVNERFTPKTEPPRTVKDIDNDIKTLQKNKDRMSPRKFEEQKSILEAERKEVKAREDFEAKKIQDHKDAERIMRKPAKDRTPDEVRQIVEDIENTPVAEINARIHRAETKMDRIYFRKVKHDMQRLFVDSGAAFENMARDAIKAGNEEEGRALYEATNSLRQTEKSVQYQIVDAQTDFNYHRIGESAHDITTPLKKRGKKIGKPMYEDTQELLFHMHNVDRMKQGKPVFSEYTDGLTSQKRIKEIRKKYTPKELKFIDGQIDKVHKYFDNLRTLRRESGLISKELDEYLQELYPNYIPTKRMGDFERGISGDHNIVGAKDLQKAKGSNLDLLSLEDQMLRATNEVWTASKTNNLIQKVMALQDVKGKKLNLSELVDADGNPKTFEDIISESLFATGTEKGGYHLRWFDDGVAKSAECTKEVYDSLKALNGQGLNLPSWAKMVGDVTTGPANSIFKKLCTEWNPFFALYRNPMRDIQDAFMYSKDFKGFISHMPVAMKRMAKQDEYWQLWKASGGTQSSLFDITSQIKKSKNPMRRIGLMNQAVEQYPRFTEFCSILDNELKKAGKNGTPLPVSQATREMVDKASQAGADITVNFGRTGEVTKLLNRYAVPFLNPGVQGVSKAVRLVTERSGAKAWIGLATKAAVLGFTPAVINEALLGDDKGYQRMNARDKLTNYIFKVGDNYIKIPKGRLLSLIGMGGMKMINPSYNWKEMRDVAMNQSAPANPFSDNLFMTAIKAARNQTWYGGNIQSDYEESPKIDQTTVYDANTTDLAKWLSKTDFMKSIDAGKAKGLSPKKIDAMLKGYSGVLGEIGMPLMTQRAKGGGLKGSLGRLFKKTFTIDPTYQNELSTKFYENEATAEREGTKEESKYFKDQSSRVSAINDIIRDVNASNRSYKEKNEIADALTQYKNRIMENANKGAKMASDYKMRDMDAIANVVGKSAALDYTVGNKTDKEARKACGNDEKFYKGYRAIQGMGASSKTAKSVALVSAGADKKVYEAYGIKDDYRQRAKDYFKNGGSTEEFTKANEITAGSGKDYMLKAMKLAKAKAPDRVYAVNDIYQSKMVAARVLSKAGFKDDFFTSKNLKPKIDTDGSGRYSKAEVYNFVSKQKASTNVKNALWSAIAYKNMKPMFGSPTVPKENYKLKGASGSPKGGSSKATSGKPGQVDYSKPASKEFMNNFGANMDAERRRVGEKLYRAAKASKKGINAPYKNDKDYLPKETLQVVRSGDERLDTEALKALKGGGIKALVKQAQKNLPKIKEPDDNTTFDDDGSSGGGGRGYYRRHGRRGHGRGGSGGSGSSGTATKKPEEIKTKDAKYNPSTWSPTAVSTDSGWTDAQIRKVYNTLIKQGLTQQQAVARIAQLWHTRFS